MADKPRKYTVVRNKGKKAVKTDNGPLALLFFLFLAGLFIWQVIKNFSN